MTLSVIESASSNNTIKSEGLIAKSSKVSSSFLISYLKLIFQRFIRTLLIVSVRLYKKIERKIFIMPVIARFYGILIKMYFREHGVPHFHSLYGEYNGVFEIEA